MKYNPVTDPNPLPYSPFKSCTIPRPIGWLSSVSATGVENIAPYSQWQNLASDPPMVMFSANQHPDGRRKDTVINAETTGWFVWNMATYPLRESVNKSAMALAPGSRMRPPASRQLDVRLAASATSQRVVFDGKPVDLVLR